MTDEKVQRKTRRRIWTGLVILLALVGMGALLVRSLTPRMPGMGPTGTLPGMQINLGSDTQNMDMAGDSEGMNMSGMDMNSQEQSPTNP